MFSREGYEKFVRSKGSTVEMDAKALHAREQYKKQKKEKTKENKDK